MSDVVLRVEDLGKRYRIGARHAEMTTFRERLIELASAPLRNLKRLRGLTRFDDQAEEDSIWALRHISFEVHQGDVVGVIGRNGAGKSTLLKVLSRITPPTEGSAHIQGRVRSLLEVGTGFHQELTGRENLYLNGAILGMKKAHIDSKFDEIVAFAEIEKFLDTPVKHYSSGMYVRLAFAVAAHLEPEILLIDEVLAVGDRRFQKKCLGKIAEVSKQGRTVLFVSHNIAMVSSLCTSAMLLEGGRMVSFGPTREVVDRYMGEEDARRGEVDFRSARALPGDGVAKLLAARIVNEQGQPCSQVRINEPIAFEMEYRLLKNDQRVTPNIHMYDAEGVCVFAISDAAADPNAVTKSESGDYLSRCSIPADFLNDRTYYVGFALTTMRNVTVHFWEKDLLMLTVIDPIDGVISRNGYAGVVPGTVRPNLEWMSERIV